jgi:hypothetical protein
MIIQWLKKIFKINNTCFLFTVEDKKINPSTYIYVIFDNKKDMLDYVRAHIESYFEEHSVYNNEEQLWELEDEELIYNYLDNKDAFRAVRLFNFNVIKKDDIIYRLEKCCVL